MGELVQFLAGIKIFKDFSPRELEKIAAICKPVSFREENVILEEGARGRDLFIIRSGRVSITLSKSPGRYDLGTITRCEPGQVVGELAFIDGARRSTWVIALENGEALRIGWDDFSRLVEEDDASRSSRRVRICGTGIGQLGVLRDGGLGHRLGGIGG